MMNGNLSNNFIIKNKKRMDIKNIILFIALLSLFCNLKFFIFIFCCIILFFYESKSFVLFVRDLIPATILILCFALISIIFGNDTKYILLESRDFLILFLVLVSLKVLSKYIFYNNEVVNQILNFFVALAIVKLAIMVYSISKGISASEVVKIISDFTGWELQTYDVQDTLVSRVQFPIDLASCFIIPFQLQNLKSSRKLKNWIILFLLYFSILVSMSRVFWFISLINTTCFFLIINKGRLRISYLIISLLMLLVFSALFYSSLSSIIETRLSTSNNYHSDLQRVIQDIKIKDKIEDALFFGRGVGYYIPDYLRSYVDANKYAYESQVLATIMKVGFVGFFMFVVTVIYIIFNNVRSSTLSPRLLTVKVVMIFLWIFSGYFNPLLLNVPAGIALYLVTKVDYQSFPEK
ncbi:TPA: O-antigen ligase family protein [Pluralibacter gergoviae]